jgi:1,4-alpha-glucan branching enzyme
MIPQGYLSIVLHAHLPYVRHSEFDDFLEEEWLYEAVVETYLPLIQRFRRLVEEGVDFRFSMVCTPSLASMLTDPLLKQRTGRYLDRLIELAGKEVRRTRNEAPEYQEVASFYLDRFHGLADLYHRQLGGDIVGGLADLQRQGVLEIMTCAATHGFLPLLQPVPQAVEAQVKLGAQAYRHFFGRDARGIWLPECAYFPGLDRVLAKERIRFFLLDTHGILFANPRPVSGVYAPLYTPSGVAAFGRDAESSKQVWSSKEGYPGDVCYRDFYRDIGYDLPFDYIRPYIQPTGLRKFTGLKYHRITGNTDQKEIYRPGVALERVAEHAGNFLFNRELQVRHLAGQIGRPPIITAPYDAELYGHWWFEGPDFLYFLAKKVHHDTSVFKLTTPIEYLERHPVQQMAGPAASSWGDKGYFDVWVNDSNDWIYPHLHEIAERMVRLARSHRNADGVLRRALNQCARELVLAQSSDWAFLISTGTAVDYSTRRTRNHVGRFLKLCDQIDFCRIDEGYLASLEAYDNIFPFIDYSVYAG